MKGTGDRTSQHVLAALITLIALLFAGLFIYIQATRPSKENRQRYYEQVIAETGHLKFGSPRTSEYFHATHELEKLKSESAVWEWTKTLVLSLGAMGSGLLVIFGTYRQK